MVQLVDFTTWSRHVNGVVRESTLDHVYASDPTLLTNLSDLKPIFGNHCMVHFKYTAGRSVVKTTFILYSGARIRWTCHSYKCLNAGYIYNYEHVTTQQYVSDMESPICA